MITLSVRLLAYTSIFSYVISDIADDVKYVCEGINTCYSRSNNSLPSDSCCRPCECDKVCLEKGTCCSDVANISDRPSNVIKQACLPSIKYSKFARGTLKTDMFYVRAKCPASYVDRQTINKCEIGEPESFEDIPFVSSKSGNIVYKNRHCAECHGENDIIPWKLIIDIFCIKEAFLSARNASSLADALMTACSLSFMRPNITPWKHVACHEEDNLISSCFQRRSHRQSHQPSDNTTKELRELCANDKSALTVHAANKVYANVYCYLCNERSRVTCDYGIQDQKIVKDMYFLLNFTPIKDYQHEVELKERACNHQDFYDIYFETCRRIHCPMFEVLSNGRCTSVIDSSRLNYGFSFALVPEVANRTNQSDADIRHVTEELSRLITAKLRLDNCLICGTSLWSKSSDLPTKSGTILYLKHVFTTSRHCERELLLSTAAKLEDEEEVNKNLTIVIESLSFHIEYIPSDETFRHLRGKHIYTNKRCKCLIPSKFINCPKVTLSIEEYETVVNKVQFKHLQAARSNKGFEVCLNDYKTSSKAERSNGERMGSLSYLLIPFTGSVLMCVAMLE